jgi:hypothetical protein
VNRLKIGIVDSSDGNGHMFSFPSFFNGYDPSELEQCPFPAILSYLPRHITPVESLHKQAEISAVWMRDLEYAKSVARFGKISSVFSDIHSLIEHVDAVIITNDEPIGRESVLASCIASGKMLFVDKLIARTSENLEKYLALQHYPGQLYCASAISFSTELKRISWNANTEYMVLSSPKNWANYGIHVVDAFLEFASLNCLKYKIGTITHNGAATERQLRILNTGGGEVFLRTEGGAYNNFSIKVSNSGIEQEVLISDPFDSFVNMLGTWLSRNPSETYHSEYKRYNDSMSILGFDRK